MVNEENSNPACRLINEGVWLRLWFLESRQEVNLMKMDNSRCIILLGWLVQCVVSVFKIHLLNILDLGIWAITAWCAATDKLHMYWLRLVSVLSVISIQYHREWTFSCSVAKPSLTIVCASLCQGGTIRINPDHYQCETHHHLDGSSSSVCSLWNINV